MDICLTGGCSLRSWSKSGKASQELYVLQGAVHRSVLLLPLYSTRQDGASQQKSGSCRGAGAGKRLCHRQGAV